MDRPRRKLTYSNVISTLCLFLLVGGGTALAASQLKPNSVGPKQLKKNAVTAAKLKAGAVTGAKIAAGAITADKLAPGVASTEKVVVGAPAAPAPVPAPGAPDLVKGSHGTLHAGQEAPIFSYGPFTITAQCKEAEKALIPGRVIYERFLISSSTPDSAFASRWEGSRGLGPETPEEQRVVGESPLPKNEDSYRYAGPGENTVSASSIGGQAFNAFIGVAADEESGTCWYWLNANLIS